MSLSANNGAALYPTIPRINHSCCPNVVWSWKQGNHKRKEVRALHRSVMNNYMDDC